MATETNEAFIKRRRLLLGTWRSMGPVLVAAVAIFYGTLWFSAPILVSPFAVMNRLQENTLDQATLQTMAIMLPLVTTLLCLVLGAVVALIYGAARVERRYQAMLENR